MGIGGISIWQLLIVLVIVILLFGTKKLRNMGGDLGNAIKNFRSAVKDGEVEQNDLASADKNKISDKDSKDDTAKVIEGEITDKHSNKVA